MYRLQLILVLNRAVTNCYCIKTLREKNCMAATSPGKKQRFSLFIPILSPSPSLYPALPPPRPPSLSPAIPPSLSPALPSFPSSPCPPSTSPTLHLFLPHYLLPSLSPPLLSTPPSLSPTLPLPRPTSPPPSVSLPLFCPLSCSGCSVGQPPCQWLVFQMEIRNTLVGHCPLPWSPNRTH